MFPVGTCVSKLGRLEPCVCLHIGSLEYPTRAINPSPEYMRSALQPHLSDWTICNVTSDHQALLGPSIIPNVRLVNWRLVQRCDPSYHAVMSSHPTSPLASQQQGLHSWTWTPWNGSSFDWLSSLLTSLDRRTSRKMADRPNMVLFLAIQPFQHTHVPPTNNDADRALYNVEMDKWSCYSRLVTYI